MVNLCNRCVLYVDEWHTCRPRYLHLEFSREEISNIREALKYAKDSPIQHYIDFKELEKQFEEFENDLLSYKP